MGLKPARSADAFLSGVDPDETPEVPDGIPRHGNPRDGRPKIRHVDDPTRMSYWTRASKFGKPIESSFLIDRNELRLVVWAMGRHDDLQMESQAVATLEERADKDELTRVAQRAIELAGGRRAAAKGTALHKLRERKDRGEDLAFVGPKTWAALDAWSAIADRFTQHGSEQFVVCDRWQVAGTYDALWSPRWPMTAPDGTEILPGDRLVVDLKSGRWGPEWFGPTYCVQLAVYAHGQPYRHVPDEKIDDDGDGRGFWPGDTMQGPRRDWALIPHVPVDSPEDAGLVWVDLRKGEQLAVLAAGIRAARKLDGLFLPAELPVEVIVPPVAPTLIERIVTAPSEAVLDALWQDHAEMWHEGHTAAVRARLAELSSATTEVQTS